MVLAVTPGGANDDALLTLAAFKAYADARGMDYSGSIDTEVEQAIRRATTWVEGLGGPTARLATRWPGIRADPDQRRVWPRSGAAYIDGTGIASDIIPAPVEEAVAEAAFYDLINPGVLHSKITPGDAIKSASAGPAKVEYFGPGDDAMNLRPMLTAVTDLLAGLLTPDLDGPHFMFRAVGS